MNNKHIFSLLITGALLAFLGGTAKAAFSGGDAGTATAQFLKLGPSARAEGMGEAFAATADDSSSVYWNVAGLADVNGYQAQFTHAQLFEDIHYEWASYAQQAFGGGLGVGVQYLSYGDVNAYNTSGNSEGTLSPSDMALSVAYGRKLLGMKLGVGIKYISSQIQHKATAVAADAGIKYSLDRLMLGAAFTNMGTHMTYISDSDPLPFIWRAGAGYRLLDGLTAEADLVTPSDANPYAAFGAEYTQKLGEKLSASLRAGYNGQSNSTSGSTGYTLGMGVKCAAYSFDYAYAPMGELGNTNRFSLGVAF